MSAASASFIEIPPTTKMVSLSSSDLVVVAIGVILASLYLFKDILFAAGSSKKAVPAGKGANGNGYDEGTTDSRDFVAKLKATVSHPSDRLLFPDPCLFRTDEYPHGV